MYPILKVLNLYGGLGAIRKYWTNCEVTAVELNPEIAAVYAKLYPLDAVIVGDAHQYLLDNADKFDVVFSGPPCQSHSRMNRYTRHRLSRYPDLSLYQEIIYLDNFFQGKPWVVENVVPYYTPLVPPTQRIGRHLFWSNLDLAGISEPKKPAGFINGCTLAARARLQDWLGIHFDEVIYYGGNHCPAQVLRNCVHPDIGKQIFDRVRKSVSNSLERVQTW